MWDKDLLWNDCIAEGMLDLGKHFRRAYKKKNEVLKLFESEQTERAKEAIVKTQQALKSEQVCCGCGACCFDRGEGRASVCSLLYFERFVYLASPLICFCLTGEPVFGF